MLDLRPEDIIHKSYINRLLIEIIDRPALSQNLAFKGGTCAGMLGYLDRFSVDLDFDVMKNADETTLRREFHRVFDHLGLADSASRDTGPAGRGATKIRAWLGLLKTTGWQCRGG